MSEQFLEADIHALLRLAVLVDMFWLAPDKALAAEIRLEQQAFGLTPIDRRRLQWRVEEEAEEQQTRTRTRQAPPADDVEDPRALLKVVSR